jgi:hypothetical protein
MPALAGRQMARQGEIRVTVGVKNSLVGREMARKVVAQARAVCLVGKIPRAGVEP